MAPSRRHAHEKGTNDVREDSGHVRRFPASILDRGHIAETHAPSASTHCPRGREEAWGLTPTGASLHCQGAITSCKSRTKLRRASVGRGEIPSPKAGSEETNFSFSCRWAGSSFGPRVTSRTRLALSAACLLFQPVGTKHHKYRRPEHRFKEAFIAFYLCMFLSVAKTKARRRLGKGRRCDAP